MGLEFSKNVAYSVTFIIASSITLSCRIKPSHSHIQEFTMVQEVEQSMSEFNLKVMYIKIILKESMWIHTPD